MNEKVITLAIVAVMIIAMIALRQLSYSRKLGTGFAIAGVFVVLLSGSLLVKILFPATAEHEHHQAYRTVADYG